tara:strand:- start:96 stop:245 length:150 start_codon:yes stop_codon:yes gene_type:complete
LTFEKRRMFMILYIVWELKCWRDDVYDIMFWRGMYRELREMTRGKVFKK